jgi:hypothetical protein
MGEKMITGRIGRKNEGENTKSTPEKNHEVKN